MNKYKVAKEYPLGDILKNTAGNTPSTNTVWILNNMSGFFNEAQLLCLHHNARLTFFFILTAGESSVGMEGRPKKDIYTIHYTE